VGKNARITERFFDNHYKLFPIGEFIRCYWKNYLGFPSSLDSFKEKIIRDYEYYRHFG